MFRGRRQERHDGRAEPWAEQGPGGPGGWRRYQMRQQVFALGNDFYIEDEHGQRVYRIDGKVVRVRDTLVFRDMLGQELCKIQRQSTRSKGETHGCTIRASA